MKYLIKAITTNNRDLKTSILFSFEEKAYLFNCPDGFQRMALNQRMKFKSVRYVFISGMQPDFYSGLPGFYLSARESSQVTQEDSKNFKIGIYGPPNFIQLFSKGKSFVGNFQNMELSEFGSMHKYLTEKYEDGRTSTCITDRVYHNEQGQVIKQQVPQQQQEEEVKSYEMHEAEGAINVDISNYFDDGDLKIIPVKVYSLDKKELDTYSFICIPKQGKGKFHPEKALKLGLTPHFHFKILNNGQPVTLEDGQVIHPYQVMDPPLPSQCVVFVFIPNANYLESFLSEENRKVFAPFFQENIDKDKQAIHLIYHSITFDVLMNESYRDFMRNFGENVQHVIDCDQTNDEIVAKTKSYILSSRHRVVCPSLIPIPTPILVPYSQQTKNELQRFYEGFKYLNSKMGLVYNLYPFNTQGLSLKTVIAETESQAKSEREFQEEMEKAVRSVLLLKKLEDPSFDFERHMSLPTEVTDEEPQILFLGTISMKPTMYRSASAVYLFIKGHGILMDSAEGSYGQIYDHFRDKEQVDYHIRQLRVIFITHIHGDHQLGVVKIMSERDKLVQEDDPSNRLYIATPVPMYEYLDDLRKSILRNPANVVLVPLSDLNPEPCLYYESEYQPYNSKKGQTAERYQPESDFKCRQSPRGNSLSPKSSFNKQTGGGGARNVAQRSLDRNVPERTLEQVNEMIESHQPKDPRSLEMLDVLHKTMNIKHMKAIETNHCIESFACLIESPDFGRIFYSGDTRVCQTVLNYAQKVTLLIHEATFDDSLEVDAQQKKHTTMGQAIEISRKCQPWRTVLTHFSPRYQKIAETDQRHTDNKVMVAFDHMRVRLSYLEWAYLYLDVYKKFFSNDDVIEYEDGEEDEIMGVKPAQKRKQPEGVQAQAAASQKQKNKQVRQKTQ